MGWPSGGKKRKLDQLLEDQKAKSETDKKPEEAKKEQKRVEQADRIDIKGQ